MYGIRIGNVELILYGIVYQASKSAKIFAICIGIKLSADI